MMALIQYIAEDDKLEKILENPIDLQLKLTQV